MTGPMVRHHGGGFFRSLVALIAWVSLVVGAHSSWYNDATASTGISPLSPRSGNSSLRDDPPLLVGNLPSFDSKYERKLAAHSEVLDLATERHPPDEAVSSFGVNSTARSENSGTNFQASTAALSRLNYWTSTSDRRLAFMGPLVLPPAIGNNAAGQPDAEQTMPSASPLPSQASPNMPEITEYPNQHYHIAELGVEVRAGVGRLSGEVTVPGLAIEKVDPGSPAAAAGLRALQREPRRSAEGALALVSILVGFVFPPVIYWWAWKMNDENRLGQACDFIIGVDGERVSHVLDVEQALRRAKDGDIIYLNVLREGKRVQVPIHLTRQKPAGSGHSTGGQVRNPPSQ